MNTSRRAANARMTITPRGLWEHNAYQSDTSSSLKSSRSSRTRTSWCRGRAVATRARSCR
ncbi:MAG: hypothetical protein V5B38_13085 [Candidatus Accumulibacter propinquus]